MSELSKTLLKNLQNRSVCSGGVRPGVIKIGFATGRRFSPGMGPVYKSSHTPSHNALVDPDVCKPYNGVPGIMPDMIIEGEKGVRNEGAKAPSINPIR